MIKLIDVARGHRKMMELQLTLQSLPIMSFIACVGIWNWFMVCQVWSLYVFLDLAESSRKRYDVINIIRSTEVTALFLLLIFFDPVEESPSTGITHLITPYEKWLNLVREYGRCKGSLVPSFFWEWATPKQPYLSKGH